MIVRRNRATSLFPSVIERKWSLRSVAFLILLHLPLGIVMSEFPALAKLHALTVLLVGIVWGVQTRQSLNVALVIAYISGSELLWRMSKGVLFWEFGKEAV